MDKEKVLVRSLFYIVLAGLVFLFPSPVEAVSHFRDITSQKINPDKGTIEFNVRLLRDISSDRDNPVLLLGVTSDGAGTCELELIQDTIIARRFFGGCLLNLNGFLFFIFIFSLFFCMCLGKPLFF